MKYVEQSNNKSVLTNGSSVNFSVVPLKCI